MPGCFLNLHLVLCQLCILLKISQPRRPAHSLQHHANDLLLLNGQKGTFFAEEHVSKYLTISTFFNIMFPSGGNTELPEAHYSP